MYDLLHEIIILLTGVQQIHVVDHILVQVKKGRIQVTLHHEEVRVQNQATQHHEGARILLAAVIAHQAEAEAITVHRAEVAVLQVVTTAQEEAVVVNNS